MKSKRKYKLALPALTILIIAAILIELISLAQYRYTHQILENELDHRATTEMSMKALRVRGILKSNERMMRNYQWPIQSQLGSPGAPERIQSILRRIVSTNSDVVGSFVAFTPNYFSEYGRLCELVAYRREDSIIVKQVAGPNHDYTKSDFYRLAVEKQAYTWSDPYIDKDASGVKVTTYSMPITDSAGEIIGALGLDLSTKGIIDTINTRHDFPSTYHLLLTEDGQLISKLDSLNWKFGDAHQIVELINDSTAHHELSSDGRSCVITFKDNSDNSLGYIYHANMMGKPHWQMVMVCYDDELFIKLNDLRRNFVLMMLGLFSLLGIIMYLFYRNMRHLNDSRLQQERTDSELRIAKGIQSEMLPEHPISRPEVDISGSQVTALEVGGDLYDYFVRDEKLYFCIGDVSGKGVPSSLVMAVVHSLFRSMSLHDSNPAHIIQSINKNVSEGNKTSMFVTLFVGVLDLPTGRLRYCNAGHDAPLIIHDEVKKLPVNANLPVGVIHDFKYSQQQETLPSGSTLFLYTDGLTEAADETHKLYGLDRIISTAQECLEQGMTSPEELMGAMHFAVTSYVGTATQSDDLTMLTLNYRQPQETIVLHESITLPNDVHIVPELNHFIQSVSQRLNLEASLSHQLMLAVEEAVVNVMNYAYPIGTQGDVNITANCTDKDIKIIITDGGKAFDPTTTNKADTTLNAEERPIGGLGILLVQQLMDTINYERTDDKNVLTLKKSYQSSNDKKKD